jgi:hypothetical protein
MTEPSSSSAPPLGLFARALGVITAPAATFRSVVAHPSSAGILFLGCLLMGLATALPQFTEPGQAMALDMQIREAERFSGRPIDPQARQGMETMARYAGYTSLVSMFIFIPVVTLIMSGIYWLIFNVVLGGSAQFKQVLAVMCHSQIILAVGTVIAAPIQYAQGVMTPAGPFHLGALAAPFDPNGAVARLLGTLTIVGFWQSIVTGIGMAVLYRKRPAMMIGTLVTLYVLLTVFFSVLLPMFISSAVGTR